MYPVRITQTGTGVATQLVVPDIDQNPFAVAVAVQLVTGGLTTAIVSIEHTYDYRVVQAVNFNGATASLDGSVATAAWFPNLNLVNITATIGTGSNTAVCNYSFPVAALRLNVVSATATSIVIANFIQATNAP